MTDVSSPHASSNSNEPDGAAVPLTGDQSPTVYLGNDMTPEMQADVARKLAELGITVQTDQGGSSSGTAKTIVVISPKGGSGKTTVSSNLAVALAAQHPGRVVVVDLDTQFGNLGLALSVTPASTLAQLARTGRIDATSLKLHLTAGRHDLYLLAGATDPIDAESVQHGHVAQVLPLLADSFDYVIVDTPAGLDERTVAALECATDMLMVTSLDVASIRSLRTAKDALDQLDIAAHRKYVLNRADAKVGLDPSDAEEVMGMTIDVSIPASDEVTLSLNLGTPIVVSEPKSNVARAFRELAQTYSPSVVVDDGKRRWFR